MSLSPKQVLWLDTYNIRGFALNNQYSGIWFRYQHWYLLDIAYIVTLSQSPSYISIESSLSMINHSYLLRRTIIDVCYSLLAKYSQQTHHKHQKSSHIFTHLHCLMISSWRFLGARSRRALPCHPELASGAPRAPTETDFHSFEGRWENAARADTERDTNRCAKCSRLQ